MMNVLKLLVVIVAPFPAYIILGQIALGLSKGFGRPGWVDPTIYLGLQFVFSCWFPFILYRMVPSHNVVTVTVWTILLSIFSIAAASDAWLLGEAKLIVWAHVASIVGLVVGLWMRIKR